MTNDRNFKRLVRDRMAKTGERYAAARAHILAAGPEAADPVEGPGPGKNLFPGVTAIGGQQADVAAARNLCANAGIVGPDGRPLSEALVFGLCGGVGFLYGVFVYDEGPTMTIVARNDSMPDPFLAPLFDRIGATVEIATTGGAKKAAATLDAVLAGGIPALATVGAGALAYLGEAEAMAAMAPHVVGVVGVTGDGRVLLDDRSPEPIAVDRSVFDAARAAYTKAKHRLITVTEVDGDHDWSAAVAEAVTAGVVGFDTPPVPQFAANIGRAGLTKFHRLLTANTDAKGWPRVFAQGPTAALGLTRLIDCIDHAYTAPAAGRPLQADFLESAASLLADVDAGSPAAVIAGAGAADRWVEAAAAFRRSGDAWSAMVAVAVEADPAVARYAELSAERAQSLDAGAPDPAAMAALALAQQEAIAGCELSPERATEAFAAVATELATVIEAEEEALTLLGAPPFEG